MPRNVRNFWLNLSVDGKRTDVASGPVAKDGGFELRIKINRPFGAYLIVLVELLAKAYHLLIEIPD